MNVFDDMGFYWAEIADQNQTEKQLEFLKKTLKSQRLILDLACGTGRHLIPLSQSGCEVIGLDISLKLLRIAKSRLRDAQVVRGDMRFLPFKTQTFSAAISMDTSFGYLNGEQEDLHSLRAIKETLIESGMLIVDIFNRQHLVEKYRAKRLKWAILPALLKPNLFAKWLLFRFFKWKEYPTFFLLQKRSVDADGSQLHDVWWICDKADGQIRVFEHIVRLYELKRLQELLETSGFKPNFVYGDYCRQSFGHSSGRLILVTNTKFL